MDSNLLNCEAVTTSRVLWTHCKEETEIVHHAASLSARTSPAGAESAVKAKYQALSNGPRSQLLRLLHNGATLMFALV